MSGDVPMFRLAYDGDVNDTSTGDAECPPSNPIPAAPASEPEADAGPFELRRPSDGSILRLAFEYASESLRDTCVGMIIVSRLEAGGADAGPERRTASSTILVSDTPEAAPIKCPTG
jgi:hypothetical protein